ncbi:oxidoreductase [Microtetraspora sp. NBRC 13810]|uniref:NADP-dependent oxidoreductase n=1 Tax=Microtetraspora sp. NBRC 13810 TaxID=3030990 RepID=UPI0024A40FE8|nr:NADP-dependent oxidoreductase [Microtetraspora sp. NBRC 13810]GLW09526.1 oxidoreductase [Microtetraspora sp. NBRC 13810]
MKAAAIHEYGGPDVLKPVEVPTPQAGDGQIRVRIRAAGVQPIDCAVRGGWKLPGLPETFPRVLGNEFAGVVDQVGEGVTGIAEGQEVLGFNTFDCYAEYIVVNPDQVTAKPPAMPWDVAGGFTAGTQTAHIALGQLAVGAGDTFVVHAAAGSVGAAAVQLARLRGATVIGTAREANHDYLRSLGAIPVTYGPGLVDRVRALAPGGVDAALDGAGGEALTASLDLVKDRDRILTIADHGRAAELGVQTTRAARSADRLAELAGLYASGDLRVLIRNRYPLDRAADAHRDVETRHGRGKVVLVV